VLPFTEQQFLDVFSSYNRALWPAAGVLWLATVGLAVAWLWRPQIFSHWLAWLLALHWLWSAFAYHFAFFTSINRLAYLFAALFLVEAAALARFAWSRTSLDQVPALGPWRIIGAAFLLYSLCYPLLVNWAGFDYPRMPTFGVPCPTTLLTAGFLVGTVPRPPRRLSIVPILWSVVGGSAAVLFGVLPDFALMIAGALLVLRSTRLGATKGRLTTG
jgi:hypothetical protein